MGKYTGPSCRLCRREGEKLFLKGTRCYTHKCAIERRQHAPGQHGAKRAKLSNYGLQLREKQKLKRMYGLLERQFRNYFNVAAKRKGVTGTVLLQFLERRLDNVVYRMGIAPTRRAARQFVSHKHITVNGEVINIPSYTVKVGDIVGICERSKDIDPIRNSLASGAVTYQWLEFDRNLLQGRFLALPERTQIPENIKEQLIVELYSK